MEFYLQPEISYLRIAGPHQVDFLQRQTTNDVKSLAPGGAILAALTTPTARILDVFTLFLENIPGAAEPAIGAIGIPGRVATTTAYLKNRIFFMDRVGVENASGEFIQVDLFGKEAELVLTKLGLPYPRPGEILQAEVAGARLEILGHLPGAGLGYRLVFPAQACGSLLEALENAGARRLERDAYDVRRIEAGLPSGEGELTEEYTPLEVGLEGAISDQKGCYTGQEVIARQITYEKVTRLLVGLRLERGVASKSPVFADGKPIGVVTSAADSPTFGPIALAVVRRPSYEPGTKVIVRAEGGETGATVAALPFG